MIPTIIGMIAISIHAPPRGATKYLYNALVRELISIHAPPRGATSHPHAVEQIEIYFNSRPSARGDVPRHAGRIHPRQFQFTPLREGRQVLDEAKRQGFPISIHAPPRGATTDMRLVRSFSSFQFTPLREGRHTENCSEEVTERFQFTPLREGRRPHLEQLGRHIYFNSRPSARGDQSSLVNLN